MLRASCGEGQRRKGGRRLRVERASRAFVGELCTGDHQAEGDKRAHPARGTSLFGGNPAAAPAATRIQEQCAISSRRHCSSQAEVEQCSSLTGAVLMILWSSADVSFEQCEAFFSSAEVCPVALRARRTCSAARPGRTAPEQCDCVGCSVPAGW